jgi:hypothetical protein
VKLTPETASASVSKLALMAYFPGDPDIRAALVWALLEMIETEEQMQWLVSRALRLYTKWPGVAELRALYCSHYRPKDGQEAYSSVYPDGIPSERRQAEGRDAARGEPVSSDPTLDRMITQAAARKRLKPIGREAN